MKKKNLQFTCLQTQNVPLDLSQVVAYFISDRSETKDVGIGVQYSAFSGHCCLTTWIVLLISLYEKTFNTQKHSKTGFTVGPLYSACHYEGKAYILYSLIFIGVKFSI